LGRVEPTLTTTIASEQSTHRCHYNLQSSIESINHRNLTNAFFNY